MRDVSAVKYPLAAAAYRHSLVALAPPMGCPRRITLPGSPRQALVARADFRPPPVQRGESQCARVAANPKTRARVSRERQSGSSAKGRTAARLARCTKVARLPLSPTRARQSLPAFPGLRKQFHRLDTNRPAYSWLVPPPAGGVDQQTNSSGFLVGDAPAFQQCQNEPF